MKKAKTTISILLALLLTAGFSSCSLRYGTNTTTSTPSLSDSEIFNEESSSDEIPEEENSSEDTSIEESTPEELPEEDSSSEDSSIEESIPEEFPEEDSSSEDNSIEDSIPEEIPEEDGSHSDSSKEDSSGEEPPQPDLGYELIKPLNDPTSPTTLIKTKYSTEGAVVADVIATDFGADPTGTIDSTSAIQAALNQASSLGGGTVFLPIGKYLVLRERGRLHA